jgi:hypothetical protein
MDNLKNLINLYNQDKIIKKKIKKDFDVDCLVSDDAVE